MPLVVDQAKLLHQPKIVANGAVLRVQSLGDFPDREPAVNAQQLKNPLLLRRDVAGYSLRRHTYQFKKNVTTTQPAPSAIAGTGNPAFAVNSAILIVPRPHDSMSPRRWKTRAISGFHGSDS